MFCKYFKYLPEELKKDVFEDGFTKFNHDALSNFSYQLENKNIVFKYSREQDFKIGAMIKEMHLESGMTQEELAEKLKTKKSVISRMENHSEDIRLSTLQKVASVFGKRIQIAMM